MSREIDTSDLGSLEVEDLKYLHDRSQISTAEFAEAVGVSEAELKSQLQEATAGAALSLEDRANTGTANTAGASQEEYEGRLKANNGLADDEEAGDEGDPAFGEEAEESYEDMSNDQLRAELSSRNLSTSGKKEDLIARLEADDESEEDEEDDEE